MLPVLYTSMLCLQLLLLLISSLLVPLMSTQHKAGQFTITLHALVGEAVQDGATLVTDGAAGSEVVFHPGVGGPGLGATN